MKRKTEQPDVDILDNNEDVVAVLLTSHLLSPLVPDHEYVISNDYNYKPKYCPCLSACMKKINYGQTRIGKIRRLACLEDHCYKYWPIFSLVCSYKVE